MNLKKTQEKIRNNKEIWKLEGSKQIDKIVELTFLSLRKEIKDKINEWRKEACGGFPNCSVSSCDLCSNCFNKLINILK
ncbi:unnamed protein product [marine sediment metagenome]|uniref:Uncharacterized protein n=1 Tax=marine sediment metagenome TaxID=412755 RepID=X1PM34_9ZZZZ